MDTCMTAPSPVDTKEAPNAAPRCPSDTARILAAAHAAGRRIAPLWPLDSFVAVNPFLGLADFDFTQAAHLMARTAGARMTMPRPFYAEAIAGGRISDTDLAKALAEAPSRHDFPADVGALKIAARAEPAPLPAPLPTVSDVAGAVTGIDWSGFVRGRVSTWAAAYFDDGQAGWPAAWRDLEPYAAWRAEMAVDRTAELLGLPNVRPLAAALPETPEQAIVVSVARLGLDTAPLELWFQRLLMSVGGWAGFARYRLWQRELQGGADTALLELLAIRVAWEAVILEAYDGNAAFARAWTAARSEIAAVPENDGILATDAVLHSAYETAWQRNFFATLAGSSAPIWHSRTLVQAVFCIDVRSEIFRRALEAVSPEVETAGFAGFFGFPIDYVPMGSSRGSARCPVLLTPRFTVRESVNGADAREASKVLQSRTVRRRMANAWDSFKTAAVSSFGFVETAGWAYAARLASDTLGLTRLAPHPAAHGLGARAHRYLGPSIAPAETGGHASGLTAEARLDTAEAVLGAMSMRRGFARFVLLVGHGSTTVNNPHATGLDCGACGGHAGDANARVAAAVLNDPQVRSGLAGRGIDVSQETRFLACLHDTTTDEITIFDEEAVPASHRADLARLKVWLEAAGHRARAERARSLGIDDADIPDREVKRRSTDWSQVRPEWGLAGCAAFIAAPRERTRGRDLGGRAFLHSYDWRQDEDFKVLELIMTAPMIVASWISLQYYGSTVDNRVFGSGNKVLHNVVGTLGVLEGSGGDLRTGLPWQSVHDGTRLAHEPLRLTVVIEAPTEAIDAVIARHEAVRHLIVHGWVHLVALSGERPTFLRYTRRLQWERI